jgi:hypothetical protein
MTGTLLGIAQLAVAIAGFAAIVEAIGERDAERWNPDVFNGMVLHALFALGFSLAPVVVAELGFESASTWRLLCGALGAQLILQALIVILWVRRAGDRLTPLWAMPVVGLGLLAVAQGWTGLRVTGAYLLGLCAHLVQAAVLFVFLVRQRRARS